MKITITLSSGKIIDLTEDESRELVQKLQGGVRTQVLRPVHLTMATPYTPPTWISPQPPNPHEISS